jgi:antirestriction protein ArdC
MNVYEIITDRIIKQLESGVAPWRKPWSAKLPVNLMSRKPYRGLNVLTLASQGYPSRFWLTFNQANKLGGKIRKGGRVFAGHLLEHWRGARIHNARRADASLQAILAPLFERLQSFANGRH